MNTPILSHIWWAYSPIRSVWTHGFCDSGEAVVLSKTTGYRVQKIADEDRLIPIDILPILYPQPGTESPRPWINDTNLWVRFWKEMIQKNTPMTGFLRAALLNGPARDVTSRRSLAERVRLLRDFASQAGIPVAEAMAEYALFAWMSHEGVPHTPFVPQEVEPVFASRRNESAATDPVPAKAPKTSGKPFNPVSGEPHDWTARGPTTDRAEDPLIEKLTRRVQRQRAHLRLMGRKNRERNAEVKATQRRVSEVDKDRKRLVVALHDANTQIARLQKEVEDLTRARTDDERVAEGLHLAVDILRAQIDVEMNRGRLQAQTILTGAARVVAAECRARRGGIAPEADMGADWYL